jgi:hypothetical protein
MRIFRTSALLGALAVASPGAAQTGGMKQQCRRRWPEQYTRLDGQRYGGEQSKGETRRW